MSSPLTSEPFLHLRAGQTVRAEGIASHTSGNPISASTEMREGVYFEWNWDGQELVVHNDRFGLQPLFYFSRPGEVCISPSLRCLLQRGAPQDLDWEAISVFLRLGYYLGEDTPFRAIRAVPPRAVFRWTPQRLIVKASGEAAQTASPLDRPTALRVYCDLFSAAIRRRLPDRPYGVMLSGGRDSRHILFELCRQGFKPCLVSTVKLPGISDARVAKRITTELDIRHQLIPVPPQTVALEQQKNSLTHYCADEHAWILGLPQVFQGHCDLLYEGTGAGDVFSAGFMLSPQAIQLFRTGQFEELSRHWLLKKNTESWIASLLAPELLQKVTLSIAIQRLMAELPRHADAPNPCGSFAFWNRTRREVALSPLSVFRSYQVHMPFMDSSLFDFLSSLPAEMMMDHAFHDEAIAMAYPQWSHIPYSGKRNPRLQWQNLASAWQLYRWLNEHRPPALNLNKMMPRVLRAGVDPFYSRDNINGLMSGAVYWSSLEGLSKVEIVPGDEHRAKEPHFRPFPKLVPTAPR